MTTQITHADSEALAAKHGLPVVEWDATNLSEDLRDKIMAFYSETKDDRVIVVFTGQDPVERLHAIRQLLAHPKVSA
ncbi:hypothetical protein [Streptomyces griseorubiginosus]|uniref:hypothetical protein n=1 Tax=Streptomyces griseorubiginosus TaxID=67304 RepID=UPI002E8100F4|nr:hypothetical protein [Streptomyces griseorubiginosus]WUB45295.1 hypothetical protein OHN19_18870 [Streptomyces griseorubiginosus]WUB53812.1 hypothetical protein OG942_18865 [Streptomyces griseorubiginosus]